MTTKLKTAIGTALIGSALLAGSQTAFAGDEIPQHERQPLFGDLHVHTNFSLDSFFGFNPNGPREAYHFAKGGEVNLFASASSKLKVPLDFAAVTDHAEYMGRRAICTDPPSKGKAYPPKSKADYTYYSDNCVAIRNKNQDSQQAECNFAGPKADGCDDGCVLVKVPCDMGEGPDNPATDSLCYKKTKQQWGKIQAAAEDFNAPGKFTTFVAYEWTGGNTELGSIHRNVIFRNDIVPDTPLHSQQVASQECTPDSTGNDVCTPSPEKLWTWLKEKCIKNPELNGCDALTITHSSNLSNGTVFREFGSDEDERSNAKLRQEMERLVEIFQSKGDSECRLGVGTNDELCDFEKIDRRQARKKCPKGNILSKIASTDARFSCVPICGEEDNKDKLAKNICEETGHLCVKKSKCVWPNNYVRNGLKEGLADEESLGVNPFKYGIIAGTDTHNGIPGATEEDQYNGNYGVSDSTPEARRTGGVSAGGNNTNNNPGGLAGVWAEENTRDSIFDALRRRETFGTSGTRLKIRLFGSWKYADNLYEQPDMIQQAYEVGVPMGRDLPKTRVDEKTIPKFLVWATKAPNSANLQRLQIIKGWLGKDGKTREKVYDVACSDGLKPHPKTHRCPYDQRSLNATVDLNECSYSSTQGAVELKTVWSDPLFNSDERAFYYARVIEYPTCRWSQWDVVRTILEPMENMPQTIQERAWSSPIWYSPSKKPLKK